VNNGKSWNWCIVEFDQVEKDYRARMFVSTDKYLQYAGHCRARGCHALAECFVSYNYVTGRQGRVSDARKVMCRAHAEAAVAKHVTQEKV
jgi:hypothetical protein